MVYKNRRKMHCSCNEKPNANVYKYINNELRKNTKNGEEISTTKYNVLENKQKHKKKCKEKISCDCIA